MSEELIALQKKYDSLSKEIRETEQRICQGQDEMTRVHEELLKLRSEIEQSKASQS